LKIKSTKIVTIVETDEEEGVVCYCPYGYELTDDESSCQDINECEIYGNDDEDDETGGETEDENAHRAAFCTHSCTNLIGKVERHFSI
jgi:Complement Clr-like EGF-like